MSDELKFILRGAQIKINQLVKGYSVVLIEDERTESTIHSDVHKALRDREDLGLSADNNLESQAPHSLDGVSQSDRKLIEQAVADMRAVENFEK